MKYYDENQMNRDIVSIFEAKERENVRAVEKQNQINEAQQQIVTMALSLSRVIKVCQIALDNGFKGRIELLSNKYFGFSYKYETLLGKPKRKRAIIISVGTDYIWVDNAGVPHCVKGWENHFDDFLARAQRFIENFENSMAIISES